MLNFEVTFGERPNGYLQTRQYVLTQDGSKWKPDGPKVICLATQKGGVGKTTLAAHLAWELASQGNRVMLVDADPQCNLSEYLIPNFSELMTTAEYTANNITSYFAQGEDQLGNSIGNFQTLPRCVQVPTYREGSGALFILPGNPLLTFQETNISVACHQAAMQGYQREIPGTLPFGIRATGKWHGANFIIIDTNPSIGTLNQILVLTSDGVVIPASPNAFTVQIIRNAPAHVYLRWVESFTHFQRNLMQAQAVLQAPSLRPKILGIVTNQVQMYAGRPTNANKTYLQQLVGLGGTFTSQMRGLGFSVADSLFDLDMIQLDSHALLSQYFHCTVPGLGDDQIGSIEPEGFTPYKGNRLDNPRQKRTQVKMALQSMVLILLQRLN